MNPEVYTPAQAAALVGVHANSIRAWCEEYAEVLSPGAAARPRQLTPGDVAIFQHVAAYRAARLQAPEILQRLREMPPETLQKPTVSATAETRLPAPITPPDALTAALTALAASISESRQQPQPTAEAVEAQRHEHETTRAEVARLQRLVITVGVAVGVLAAVLVILLILLLVRL